jgi:hypothetical protein
MPPADSVTFRAEAPRGVGLWVATVVSYVLSPLALPPLVYGAVLVHVGASGFDVARGAGIGFVFLSVVPLAYVAWMRLRGRIGSLEIRDRSMRTEPFLVALVAGGIAFAVALGAEMTGQRLLAALIGCHVLNTSLLFVVTAWWKISVHCASVSGAGATLVFVQDHVPGGLLTSPVAGHGLLVGGALLVAVMIWARVRSRAHTPLQAIAGAGLGLASYGELLLLARTVGL